MPSKRKLHVVRFVDSWCGLSAKQRKWRFEFCTVRDDSVRQHGPPDLSADDRVCKRCVKAMDRAHTEAQG